MAQLVAGLVIAHPRPVPPSELSTHWIAPPVVVALAVVAIALFVQAAIRLRRRGRADLAGADRALLFGGGLALVVLPLVSPLDGVAAPRRRIGAFVRPRGCSYAVRTTGPTGVLEVRRGARLTLGRLFTVWGQPLSATRLAGFSTRRSAPVRAYVAGRRRRGRLGAIPLTWHAQIVLELGRFVPPHRSFRFPRGT